MNKFKNIFLIIIINLVIFQGPLIEVNNIFSYTDEIIAIFFTIYFLLDLGKNKFLIKKNELKAVLILLSLIFIGLWGNANNSKISNINAIILDIFTFSKYLFTLLGGIRFFKHYKYDNKVIDVERKIISIFCFVGIAFMIVNQIKTIPSMNYNEIRYGLKSFQFIAGHPGNLGVVCNYICVILFTDMYINEKKTQQDKILLCLNLILMLSTLRTRAFCNAILFVLFYYSFYYRRNKKNNFKIIMLLSIILIFFVSIDQFQNYFIDKGRTPRSDFFKGGIILLNENIPIGAGFGNYGSFAAKKYYSHIYYKFGFYKHYGMGRDDGMFLTDNFWPMIMGELGYLGLISYILLIMTIYKILKRYTFNLKNKLISYFILFAMLINSTASSAFVHYSAVSYMFLMTYLFFIEKEEGRKINE